MKNSFQNVVKRISAGFVAVVVLGYSLLFCTVPGRGVVSAEDSWLSNFLSDTVVPLATSIVGAVGGAVPGIVAGVLLGSVRPVAELAVEQGAPLNIEHDLRLMDSYVSNAKRSDGTAFKVSCNRFYQDGQYYDFTAPLQFSNIVTSEDFNISLIVARNPDWVASSGDKIFFSVSTNFVSSGVCKVNYNIQGSSGSSSPAVFYVTMVIDYGGDYTDSYFRRFKTVTFNSSCVIPFAINWLGSGSNYPVITSDSPTSWLNSFSSTPSSIMIGAWVGYGTNWNNESNHLGYGTGNEFPSGNVSNNTSFVDYYNNQIRNYVNNNFYDYPTVIEKNTEFIIPSDETTEPTGTGAVIIIDPFTLPPDWVESDVVELNTEAYTIDYDTMIDEPLDEINYPLTPTNPLRGGANILSFGIQFLKDGGVFYIICTLLVIGLLIRFLGI